MIRWCSFCQKFLGEKPDYSDLRFTDGICSHCVSRVKKNGYYEKAEFSQLINSQKRLTELGTSWSVRQAEELITESLAMGLRPIDFLMGFVRPFLDNILFLSEDYPVNYDRKEFRRLCMKLVDISRKSIPAFAGPKLGLDVLLLAPQTSKCSFTLQWLELWLQGEGIYAVGYVAQDGKLDVTALYEKLNPKIFVIVLETFSQLNEVSLMAEQLSHIPYPPPVLITGYPIKTGKIKAEHIPGASMIFDDSDLFLNIKSHLSVSFLYDLKRNKMA